MIGCTSGNSKSQLHKARRNLRTALTSTAATTGAAATTIA